MPELPHTILKHSSPSIVVVILRIAAGIVLVLMTVVSTGHFNNTRQQTLQNHINVFGAIISGTNPVHKTKEKYIKKTTVQKNYYSEVSLI